jgi:hypothetical protein
MAAVSASLDGQKLINMYFYDGKVSLIDGASVTIILCLHILIAHHIFITFLFSVIVMVTTFTVVRDILIVLMEGMYMIYKSMDNSNMTSFFRFVTIILCLHILIAHHIFINLGCVDYFQ